MNGGSSSEDEEIVEARNRLTDFNVEALKVAKQLQLEAECRLVSGEDSNVVQIAEFESDYDESGDEIHTPPVSDADDRPGHRVTAKTTVVNEKTDFKKLKWSVGIRFPNREVFKDCVIRYSVAQGNNLSTDISDKGRGKRLRVRCIEGCPFKMYASLDKKGNTYIV